MVRPLDAILVATETILQTYELLYLWITSEI